MSSEVFAVFKQGIYRHECGGVFSSLERATDAAKALMQGERDDYHHYEVVRFALDERTAQAALKEWGGGEVIEPDEVLIVGRVGGVLAVGVRGECMR